MKKSKRLFKKLCVLFCIMFLALIGYGAYSLKVYGGRWFASGSNSYVTINKQYSRPGDILDRNGVMLASSNPEGSRVYSENEDVRRATVHVIGDRNGNVSNGADNFFASYLYGFKTTVWERIGFTLSGSKRQGDNLYLTVDSVLSAYAATLFPSDKDGAMIVMNYKTGEVLLEQSYPSFDPANMTVSLKYNTHKPYFNRAVQGLYAPGSTFKIVTAASALENIPDAGKRLYQCTGVLELPARSVTDAGNAIHGGVDLKRAFQLSCNNAYAQAALNLGDEKLRKTAEKFGFNDTFLFSDLVVEDSVYPLENRDDVELAWTGVGQSQLLVTPMHMCLIAAAVANGGVMPEPKLLLKAETQKGAVRAEMQVSTGRRIMNGTTAATLRDYMYSAVTASGGTAARAAAAGCRVCGKTGSAEIDSQENTNAWFVGFLDDEQHPYAVCVLVENAGGGGTVAAPIASKLFQWLVKFGN